MRMQVWIALTKCGDPRPIIDVRKPGCSGSQLNSRPDWWKETGDAILSPIKSEVATRGAEAEGHRS